MVALLRGPPELRRRPGPAAVHSGQLSNGGYGTRKDVIKGFRDALVHLESIVVVGGEEDGRRRRGVRRFRRGAAEGINQIGLIEEALDRFLARG